MLALFFRKFYMTMISCEAYLKNLKKKIEIIENLQVRIEMPGEKPASPHDRFPKERGKAIACTILLVFAAVLNTIVLSYVHEKVGLEKYMFQKRFF